MSSPTGNTAALLNDIGGFNAAGINAVSDLIGTIADASGAAGGIFSLVTSLINLNKPDPVLAALDAIQTAIQNDFQQLNKAVCGSQIIASNTNLLNQIGPPTTQLQALFAFVNANPQAAQVVDFILPCITALNDLGLAVEPAVWASVFECQVYWTDSGQFQCQCPEGIPHQLPASGADSGYGLQAPSPNPDGVTVFSYTFILPFYLRALSLFLAVAGSLDPSFTTNYADVLRASATLLKTIHDQILQEGLVQLSPPSPSSPVSSFFAIACEATGPAGELPGPPGIRLNWSIGQKGAFTQTGATIEYGAVEKFSGFNSMGSNYQLPGDGYSSAIFNKLQVRLLKRAKNVYIGVGLPRVRQVINQLNALVGDPPLEGPSFADWSFRQVFNLAGFATGSNSNSLSLRALAAFIIQTLPLDTPFATPNVTLSFRSLLDKFPN